LCLDYISENSVYLKALNYFNATLVIKIPIKKKSRSDAKGLSGMADSVIISLEIVLD
jgi:hypothetical protein